MTIALNCETHETECKQYYQREFFMHPNNSIVSILLRCEWHKLKQIYAAFLFRNRRDPYIAGSQPNIFQHKAIVSIYSRDKWPLGSDGEIMY